MSIIINQLHLSSLLEKNRPVLGDRIDVVLTVMPLIFSSLYLGAYTALFIICLWVICNKRSINLLLSSAAVANYVLSAAYIAIDLQRVANSITFIPDPTGVAFVYTLDYFNTLSYIASYAFVTNVSTVRSLFSGMEPPGAV